MPAFRPPLRRFAGPPAIYSWQDWHAVVGPLCRLAGASTAAVFVVACASDPGIEAVRAASARPVLGIFRCAVAAAIARAVGVPVIEPCQAAAGQALGIVAAAADG